MKTAQQIAANHADGPEVHQYRAAAIRRLAAAVQRETQHREQHALNAKELQTLEEAAGILAQLGAAYLGAKAIAQERRKKRTAVERAVRSAMAGNFHTISSIADKVAFVMSVQAGRRQVRLSSQDTLRFEFQETLEDLTAQLVTKATERTARSVVADAWTRFLEGREALQAEHIAVIEPLLQLPAS